MEGSLIPADFSACLFEHWINPPKKKNQKAKPNQNPINPKNWASPYGSGCWVRRDINLHQHMTALVE